MGVLYGWDGTQWVMANGGGATTQIGKVTCAGGETSVTFSAIPGTYSAIRLVGYGRMSTANTNNFRQDLRFNGDTGANYDARVDGVGATTVELFGQTAGYFAVFPLSTDLANAAMPCEVTIPGYAGTTWHKQWYGEAANQYGTSATNMQRLMSMGRWRSTAAITSLTILPEGSSGAYAAGTTFVLYGLS